MSRKFVLDKKTGEMVDVTPERDKEICDALAEDARAVREGMKPLTRRTGSGGYPFVSSFHGVEPDQVPEQKEFLAKRGCQMDYTPDGECIFRSGEHIKQYAQAMELYDRNGNWSPKNR